MVDSKVVFERGGFNLNEDFYVYKLKGKSKRLSAHSFSLDDVEIISSDKIDLSSYTTDSKKEEAKKIAFVGIKST